MNDIAANLITANMAGTLDGLFRERCRRSPDSPAYREFDRASKQWLDYSWQDMAHRVSRWQQALQEEEVETGDRVALLMKNGTDWVAFEQAALGLGLVVVPLYTDDRPDNIAYIINDAGCKVLLIQEEKQWKALLEHREDMPDIRRILIHNSQSEAIVEDDERLRRVYDWLPETAVALRERGGDPHKLASIVYTSGTTGRPKGVMLSHSNILSISEAACEALEVRPEFRFLSFLPLSHTFERTAGYYVPMMSGAMVAYTRSVQQLADDLQTIRPTAMISVPRIYERIYERLHQQLKKQSPVNRLMFNLAVHVGWKNFEYKQGRRYWTPTLLLWPLMEKLVAHKLQSRLGGELQFAVSGGAALPKQVARTFVGLGINVIQGYGLTETSPVLTTNLTRQNDPYSVGRPLPGIALKIDKDEELLARSPGVMMGYWNNHKATSELITADGWLHTGDKATIRDGYVYITGRIKDILVMSNGEKIPPADMESAIALDPLFEQALIVGEGKAFLGALVVINSEEWFNLAREHGLDPFDETSLGDKKLHSSLLRRISDALHDFPGYAKVRRVLPTLEPWSIENGLMTPTLKIKRTLVLEKYQDQIEKMYAD